MATKKKPKTPAKTTARAVPDASAGVSRTTTNAWQQQVQLWLPVATSVASSLGPNGMVAAGVANTIMTAILAAQQAGTDVPDSVLDELFAADARERIRGEEARKLAESEGR